MNFQQDKLYSNIRKNFIDINNEGKFIDYAQMLKNKGIINWDEGLVGLEAEDLQEIGIQRQDLGLFLQEIKKKRELFRDSSAKSFDNQSMISYKSPAKRYFTEEKIDSDMAKLFEIFNEVNNNFFNQMSDLAKITFLTLLAGEKMLFIGQGSTNVEELFKQLTKHLDIQRTQVFTHLITTTTQVDELFGDIIKYSINNGVNSQRVNRNESNVDEAKFVLLHQIFLANSPLINSLVKRLTDTQEQKTFFVTSEFDPDPRTSDVILEEFLITYFDETEPKEKLDTFDEFVDAMWTSGKKQDKSPSKKNQSGSKVNPQMRVPLSNKQGFKLDPEFFQALQEESFDKVEDNSGLLKVYLKEFREILLREKIFVTQKRWVRIFKLLKLISFTRGTGERKRICLSDCFLLPYFTSKTKQEFQIIEQLNLDLIENIARIYGSNRLYNIMDKHFWLLKPHKLQIKEIRKRHQNLPSFFNGCISHPDYFQIQTEQILEQGMPMMYYSCRGGDRKILSDDFIPVDPSKAYELKLDLRTSDEMILYVGLVCFDQNKEFIHSTQVCRVEGSELTLEGDNDEKFQLKVSKDKQAQEKWAVFDVESKDKAKNFAYLRSIGIYEQGDIQGLIGLDRVLQDNVNPYGESQENGIYVNFSQDLGILQLTSAGYEKYKALKAKGIINFGKTQIMNHFEGGTYAFAECFDEYLKKWISKSYWYKGESRGTETNKFRQGTKFVKIVLLSNYNTGFPDFKINNRDASVYWKNVQFYVIK